MDLDARAAQASLYIINEGKPRGSAELMLHAAVQGKLIDACGNADGSVRAGAVTLDTHEAAYFVGLIAKQVDAGLPGILALGVARLLIALKE